MRTPRPTSAIELRKKGKVELLLCIKLKTETSRAGITHFIYDTVLDVIDMCVCDTVAVTQSINAHW
jgi:hypothetical protein